MINVTQFIPFSINYDWLNFYGALLGSIIGGTITYMGVYITINSQKKLDEEKNRLSIIPILEYKLSYDKKDFDNSKGQLAGQIISHINVEGAVYNDKNSEEWHFNLIVNNVGVGHAQIISVELNFKENGTENIVHSTKEGYCYKLVKINETKNLMFMIYAPKKHFYKDGKPSQKFIYPIDIKIEYQDLLGNKYSQLIHAGMYKAVLLNGDEVVNHWNVADLNYYENYILLKEKNL